MDDAFWVTCPYCGESVEIYVEADVRGTFVQDWEYAAGTWRRAHLPGNKPYHHFGFRCAATPPAAAPAAPAAPVAPTK